VGGVAGEDGSKSWESATNRLRAFSAGVPIVAESITVRRSTRETEWSGDESVSFEAKKAVLAALRRAFSAAISGLSADCEG